jgi:hypothetical protein
MEHFEGIFKNNNILNSIPDLCIPIDLTGSVANKYVTKHGFLGMID